MMINTLLVAGDSVLKGIQPDSADGHYRTQNNIDFESASGMQVKNVSKFGCTVTKAFSFIPSFLDRTGEHGFVLMDFGGNDSDYNWSEIASNPDVKHNPKTPLNLFIETYTLLIKAVRERNCIPVIMTLPPIVSERYFDWLCKTLNQSGRLILKWLKYVERIGEFQGLFSEAVEGIAKVNDVPCIDTRSMFLENNDYRTLVSIDGIHPNDEGQKVIHSSAASFFSTVTG